MYEQIYGYLVAPAHDAPPGRVEQLFAEEYDGPPDADCSPDSEESGHYVSTDRSGWTIHDRVAGTPHEVDSVLLTADCTVVIRDDEDERREHLVELLDVVAAL